MRDIEVLLDEIRDMSVTRRNLNRSWTEHNISEKEKKLERVSSDLNVRHLVESWIITNPADRTSLSRS